MLYHPVLCPTDKDQVKKKRDAKKKKILYLQPSAQQFKARNSVYLLYWYESTYTDVAERLLQTCNVITNCACDKDGEPLLHASGEATLLYWYKRTCLLVQKYKY